MEEQEGWLAVYLVVIPLTAIIIVALLGAALLVGWLLSLGAIAAHNAWRKSHPIQPTEEFD